MGKILLAITTYNQSNYTRLCFDSLKKLDDDIEVIVIDDFSTDDTVDVCKEYGYEVETRDEPMGLTYSWNSAYNSFKYDGGDFDYLIIANNDILIPKGALGELVKSFEQWPYSMIVPMSTTNGVGHNPTQSIENYYQGMAPSCNDPDYYQEIQDRILDVKEQTRKANNLFMLDTTRMKMFNGFFFMMNKNIIKYEQNETELFDSNYNMTKNEDQFNWNSLIANNDFAGLCKTSFVFHYKGVSTFKVFDNYGAISNDVPEWKKQRELKGG